MIHVQCSQHLKHAAAVCAVCAGLAVTVAAAMPRRPSPCSDTFLGLWETGPQGGSQEARAKVRRRLQLVTSAARSLPATNALNNKKRALLHRRRSSSPAPSSHASPSTPLSSCLACMMSARGLQTCGCEGADVKMQGAGGAGRSAASCVPMRWQCSLCMRPPCSQPQCSGLLPAF